MTRHSNDRRRYWKLIAVLFAFVAAYQIAFSIDIVRWFMRGADSVQPPFFVAGGSNRIQGVAPRGELRDGNELIAVDGHPYTGATVLDQIIRHKHAGDTLSLTVRAAGSPDERQVQLRLESSGALSALGFGLVLIIYVGMPLFSLLLGFVVAGIRPRDPLAWLLFVLMVGFSQFGGGWVLVSTVRDWGPGVRQAGLFYHTLAANVWSTCLLLFGVYFPERLPLDRRFPWIKWVFIGPLLLGAVVSAFFEIGNSENYHAAAAIQGLMNVVNLLTFILSMAAVTGFFFCLWTQVMRTVNSDARRRLLLLIYGASVALTPLFLIILWTVFLHRAPSENIVVPCLALVAVFPLTLAYVIVVHRALDVRVVIRQGLQYALAQRGLRVMQAILTLVVLGVTVSFASDPHKNRPQRLSVIGWGTLAIVYLDRGATRVRNWTDRRFFREAYKAELILNELSESVRTIVETLPLLETVARKISDSLHVLRVAILVKGGTEYRPEYAIGYDTPPSTTLAENGPVVARLKQHGGPQHVYFDDADSWIFTAEGMTGEKRKQLQDLDAQLLLPLAYKDKLAGVIVLGPKQSEEPYAASDVRVLESVATQTGLALENSRLTEAIASEVAQRERLNRELEIAREVQERLFPQSCPPVNGLDYAGRCRPALGVGGDYYDWLELSDGALGIAIGDVSGKGVPAALLMASLQASLRSQTIAGPTDLAALMSNMNRLIFNATPSNRYATFFYAQYHPTTHRLDYVNAGHNPPMVFRGEQVLRLEEGGPVVGLFRPAKYSQAWVHLQRGDVLVLFTDGISEAMNAADEEWDEERLMQSVRACSGRCATEMLDVVMHDADDFAGGAPQHDDMTLMIVKVV